MKKLTPDIRGALLLIIIISVVATLLSVLCLGLGFGAVQLLLNVHIINPDTYSPSVYMGSPFMAITWFLNLLCVLAAVWISKWLIARHVTLRALQMSAVAIFVLLLIFPSWDAAQFPNYALMAILWAVVPAAFFYVIGKKYLL